MTGINEGKRSLPSIGVLLVGEHDFDSGVRATQIPDAAKRCRLRGRDSPQQAAPGQDDTHTVGNRSQLRREHFQRLGDTHKVRHSAAGGFAAGLPGGVDKRIGIRVGGDEQTCGFTQGPPIWPTPVSTSQIDVDAPLVRRE